MKYKNKKVKNNLVYKVLAFVLFFCLVAGYIYYRQSSTRKAQTTQQSPTINYNPPTQEEKNAADDAKNTVIQKELSRQKSVSSVESVTPIIASATKENISVYIEGIYEDGGKCTAELTQDDVKIIRQVEGFSNVSYTQCEPIVPNLPNQEKWNLTVQYKSLSYEGRTKSQELK